MRIFLVVVLILYGCVVILLDDFLLGVVLFLTAIMVGTNI